MSDWGGDRLEEDVRWRYGTPPTGNANYAWMQHMIYHLSPTGKLGLVLANGSLSASGQEGKIREEIIRDDLVEAVIAMPDKLFYSTGIPVSLWIVNRKKKQEGKTVFIDARSLGTMVTRAHRELSLEDIDKVAGVYHDFVEGKDVEKQGFVHVADIKEIEDNNFVLTPGRYVGLEELEDDGIPFEEKMETLTSELGDLLEESHRLEDEIRKQLGGIGFEL
jgi:type I restriction enzyme M protein